MKRDGDRNVRGGDRRLSDRGIGVNREGDRGGSPPPFTALTNTYDTEGAGTETIPYAAHQVVIEAWGAGGGGSRTATVGQMRGGNSGGYGKKTFSLNGGHWGKTISFTVGTHGSGRTGSTGNGTNGTGSTVQSGTFSMTTLTTNGGPGGVNNTNGTAAAAGTGGDTNTAGNTTNNANGAGAPNGGGDVTPNAAGSTPGGGGTGGNAINVNGSDGAKGRVKFSYT